MNYPGIVWCNQNGASLTGTYSYFGTQGYLWGIEDRENYQVDVPVCMYVRDNELNGWITSNCAQAMGYSLRCIKD